MYAAFRCIVPLAPLAVYLHPHHHCARRHLIAAVSSTHAVCPSCLPPSRQRASHPRPYPPPPPMTPCRVPRFVRTPSVLASVALLRDCRRRRPPPLYTVATTVATGRSGLAAPSGPCDARPRTGVVLAASQVPPGRSAPVGVVVSPRPHTFAPHALIVSSCTAHSAPSCEPGCLPFLLLTVPAPTH